MEELAVAVHYSNENVSVLETIKPYKIMYERKWLTRKINKKYIIYCLKNLPFHKAVCYKCA